MPTGSAPKKYVYTSANSLFGKYESEMRRNGPTPDRATWGERDWAWRAKIKNLADDLIEQGVWTADGYFELSNAGGRVLALLVRVLLKMRDFYGEINSRTIAQHLKMAGPRRAQEALKELADLELISYERRGREMVNIRLAFGLFLGAPYKRRTPRPPELSTLSTIRRRAPARSGDRARNFAFTYITTQEQIPTEESVRSGSIAAAAGAPPAPSPQPPHHGQKETPRTLGPQSVVDGSPPDFDGSPGPHGSARPTNGIERQRPRQHGANDNSRRGLRGAAAAFVSSAIGVLERELEELFGPGPPS